MDFWSRNTILHISIFVWKGRHLSPTSSQRSIRVSKLRCNCIFEGNYTRLSGWLSGDTLYSTLTMVWQCHWFRSVISFNHTSVTQTKKKTIFSIHRRFADEKKRLSNDGGVLFAPYITIFLSLCTPFMHNIPLLYLFVAFPKMRDIRWHRMLNT